MNLQTALAHHRSGRLHDAELAYRALLAASPDDAEILHAFGVLRHQAGDSDSARDMLSRAVAAAPERAEAHFNLGLALSRLGQHGEAASSFAEAARRRPDWPEPQYDLGRALQAAGQSEKAARAYRAALKLRPDYFQAEVNLGNLLRDLGKPDQAVAAYRRVLRRRPELADVHHALAEMLLLQKDPGAAEASLRAAVGLRPGLLAAAEALARLLLATRRFAEALPYAARCHDMAPSRADLAELLGQIQSGAGDLTGALASYRAALAIEPARHSARFGMAEALRAARDFPAAEALLRALVAELPMTWLAHHDYGNVLRDLGRFAEAEAAYRAALAITETPLALNHLAAVLRDLGRLEEAQAAAERGLALAPDSLDLKYNLAITHLTAGRLREGFALYEVRAAKYGASSPPGSAWTGQNLRGRTILVVAEQGLGDTIQFLRYLPALARTGARVLVRVPAALLTLVAGAPGVTGTFDQAEPLPAYDFHVPLMSLPHRLGLDQACPIPIPYVSADPAHVAAWRARAAALPGLKVGLVWAGNAGFKADHLRSIPAPSLAALADVAGVSLLSLQKGARDRPILPMTDWTDELHDMAQTAALVEALDLIVSVDTALAHLAGALGKPVWLLNRADTCWRWGHEGEESLWYPSLRQFRQDVPGDWRGPLARVAAALRQAALCA